MTQQSKNVLFFTLTAIVLIFFLYLGVFRKKAIETPDPCACRDVYAVDSALSLPAARKMVGVGHYNFTIQTARRNCDSAYQAEISAFSGLSGSGRKGEGIGREYFDQACKK